MSFLLTPALLAVCHLGTADLRLGDPAGGGAASLLHLETAITVEERERGLMGRDHLPAGSGMIFVFDHPQRVYFWMKDTPLSLDMLFFDGSGSLISIHPDAIPEDRRVIASPPGVQYVIELAGGEAARRHIAPGAAIAAWACNP